MLVNMTDVRIVETLHATSFIIHSIIKFKTKTLQCNVSTGRRVINLGLFEWKNGKVNTEYLQIVCRIMTTVKMVRIS
jgi:hypothetical protein